MVTKEKNNLEDVLANLFYARFAYVDRKSHPGYAVSAMGKYYASCPGIAQEDPIISNAIQNAYAGVQDGSITDNAVLSAIGLYGEKEYENIRDNSTVSTFLNSSKKLLERISESGGVTEDISKDYKEILDSIIDKADYKNIKYDDVKDKYKENKDEKAAKTLTAVSLIEQGILGLVNIDIAQSTAKGTAKGIKEQLKKLYDLK